jgi:hypothetical protein
LRLSKGANIHAKENAALWTAAYNGHDGVVKYLLERGANINMAIKHGECSKTIHLLKKYLKKQLYKGPINDQTETECGICLTEMNTKKQEIIQCQTCKKCVHNKCNEKWGGNCVYCRN